MDRWNTTDEMLKGILKKYNKLNKITPIDIMRFYDLLDKDTQIVRKKNNNGRKTKKPLSQKTIL